MSLFYPAQNSDTVTQREGASVVTESELFFGGDGTFIMNFGGRFTNVTIPKNATINSAIITFRANGTQAGSPTVDIYGEDSNDAATFALTEADFDGRTRTTATVSWSPSAWTAGTSYDSPELKTIIQEIVDRVGWASGNDMVLFVEGRSSSSAYRRFLGYVAGANYPILTITYTGGVTSTIKVKPTLLTLGVG